MQEGGLSESHMGGRVCRNGRGGRGNDWAIPIWASVLVAPWGHLKEIERLIERAHMQGENDDR